MENCDDRMRKGQARGRPRVWTASGAAARSEAKPSEVNKVELQ